MGRGGGRSVGFAWDDELDTDHDRSASSPTALAIFRVLCGAVFFDFTLDGFEEMAPPEKRTYRCIAQIFKSSDQDAAKADD